MGIFTSRFEKAMYRELFDLPFRGYDTSQQSTLSNLIFDFCSSVAHNGAIFPKGVEKKQRERVLYASFSLGTMIATVISPDEKAADITYQASMGYATSAKQSGAPKDLVVERLALITKFIDAAYMHMDQYEGDSEKQEAAMRYVFLTWFSVEPNQVTAGGLTDEIDKFADAYRKFLITHPE